eukprot:6487855-Amphidinium_carterae.1
MKVKKKWQYQLDLVKFPKTSMTATSNSPAKIILPSQTRKGTCICNASTTHDNKMWFCQGWNASFFGCNLNCVACLFCCCKLCSQTHAINWVEQSTCTRVSSIWLNMTSVKMPPQPLQNPWMVKGIVVQACSAAQLSMTLLFPPKEPMNHT